MQDTLAVKIAAVCAGVSSFLAAAVQSAAELSSEAAKNAAMQAKQLQILQDLSEVAVLGWSLAGGCLGALIAWTFMVIPGTGKQAARGVLGSIAFAFAFAPWTLRKLEWAANMTNALCVSTLFGICAWVIMVQLFPKVVPVLIKVFVKIAPGWLVEVMGVEVPNEKERKLFTPPQRRRFFESEDDEG